MFQFNLFVILLAAQYIESFIRRIIKNVMYDLVLHLDETRLYVSAIIKHLDDELLIQIQKNEAIILLGPLDLQVLCRIRIEIDLNWEFALGFLL